MLNDGEDVDVTTRSSSATRLASVQGQGDGVDWQEVIDDRA
jgi:hypothetical protein